METRIYTGALMAIVIIPIILIGSWLLVGLFGVLTLVATYEITHLQDDANDRNRYLYATELVSSALLYTFLILYIKNGISLYYAYTMIGLILLVSVYYYVALDDSMKMFLIAALYPSIGFAALFAFRESGLVDIGYLFLITVVTDVFAYFVGINFGKHKLAPTISPKKSIEGSIGGLVFTVIFSLVYIWLTGLNQVLSIELSLPLMIVFAAIISIFAQAGDLVASKMKRDHAVKDFSQLFPGHGGVMDRFDSVLFVGVILFLLSEVIV
ncbi:MAG: phosphatidate cytidylyltransferase [Candidatus Izemoplasma sp.]|nr:phosphatidate cytidylyltransferase [Candidatus Izemoplasma sp.]